MASKFLNYISVSLELEENHYFRNISNASQYLGTRYRRLEKSQ